MNDTVVVLAVNFADADVAVQQFISSNYEQGKVWAANSYLDIYDAAQNQYNQGVAAVKQAGAAAEKKFDQGLVAAADWYLDATSGLANYVQFNAPSNQQLLPNISLNKNAIAGDNIVSKVQLYPILFFVQSTANQGIEIFNGAIAANAEQYDIAEKLAQGNTAEATNSGEAYVLGIISHFLPPRFTVSTDVRSITGVSPTSNGPTITVDAGAAVRGEANKLNENAAGNGALTAAAGEQVAEFYAFGKIIEAAAPVLKSIKGAFSRAFGGVEKEGATAAGKEVGDVAKPTTEAQSRTSTRKAIPLIQRAQSPAAVAAESQVYCFIPGTPLLTPAGHELIEDIKVGDEILSADESDPNCRVVVRRVEDVFVRFGFVTHVHLSGRTISLTPDHLTFVPERGWVQAGELVSGDRVFGHDGKLVAIDFVEQDNRPRTLYNITVSEFHTFFVGCAEWGFSVWMHNGQVCDLLTKIKAATDPAVRDSLVKELQDLAASGKPSVLREIRQIATKEGPEIFENNGIKVPKYSDEVHHNLPQAQDLQEWFNDLGLDIEDFTEPLPQDVHRLKPDGLHTR